MPVGPEVYVYGVVATGAVVPDGLSGVGGTPVDLVEHGGIAAVVSDLPSARPLGRRADLMAHGTVLDGVAAAQAVVPVRFGSVLPDVSDVVSELLQPHAEQLRELLDELADRKQYTLRGRYDETTVLAEVVAENPAIAELRERTRGLPEDATYYDRARLGELVAHALAGKREADGRAILDRLLPHAVTYRLRDGARIDHLVDAAFLVAADEQGAFDRAAES
ncbi:MAG: GvpL/GvpF family gas vesicle protein, partial [Actinobacteria bacterium]|nr:GvpL/GvpF family gas vesicle protein [Actinomycetota bacterium]NIW32243.1 gas vesicle synthesis GvpLGvpF [Actinomycetota bacterium]